MSEEHFQRVSPLECRLLLSKMEIDDDDQDVILVSIEVSNESATCWRVGYFYSNKR